MIKFKDIFSRWSMGTRRPSEDEHPPAQAALGAPPAPDDTAPPHTARFPALSEGKKPPVPGEGIHKAVLSPRACVRRRLFSRGLRRIAPMIFLALSAGSAIYWIACVAAAGAAISGLVVWPVAAVFFAICYLWSAGRFPFAKLRRKKRLRRAVALLLCLLFCVFASVEALVVSGMGSDGEDGLDYIIVLGAHVKGTEPSSALLWRIERAYKYLSDNPETVAVLSGGQGSGEDISEAECMRAELETMGISPERLLLEDRSTSTYENISMSLVIIGDKSADIGIVTNNFHVWRAVRTARSAGLENVCGISAPYRNLLVIHYMVREFFAIIANSVSGNM